MSTNPQRLPSETPSSSITDESGLPLKDQIEKSRTRLKGALGDSSIQSSQPCHASEASKQDYSGLCPVCHKTHSLPNTVESQKQAKLLYNDVKANGVAADLAYDRLNTKGNMFGVLVCVDSEGKTHVLKAFSGQYNDSQKYDVPGFCPPVPNVDERHAEELAKKYDAAEATLAKFSDLQKDFVNADKKVRDLRGGADKLLKAVKENEDRIAADQKALLDNAGEVSNAEKAETPDAKLISRLKRKGEQLEARIAERIKNRPDLAVAAASGEKAVEGAQAELLKADQALRSAGYEPKLNALQEKGKELKRLRDEASEAYLKDSAANRKLKNLKDEERSFEDACVGDKALSKHGQTGWCAAPKLLAEAAKQGLTPVSMTEFWMGKKAGSNEEGAIIPSCQYCKTFMGFALCGLQEKQQALQQSLGEKAATL